MMQIESKVFFILYVFLVIICDYTLFCLANIELNYLTSKYLTFFFVFSMNFVLFFRKPRQNHIFGRQDSAMHCQKANWFMVYGLLFTVYRFEIEHLGVRRR